MLARQRFKPPGDRHMICIGKTKGLLLQQDLINRELKQGRRQRQRQRRKQ